MSFSERERDTTLSLQLADRVEGQDLDVNSLTERVFSTLQIDGQTHPSRAQVKRKVKELNARESRNQRDNSSPNNRT